MTKLIITRKEARQQGLKRYFTGLPCLRGHVSEREICSKLCIECSRIKYLERYKLSHSNPKLLEMKRLASPQRSWSRLNGSINWNDKADRNKYQREYRKKNLVKMKCIEKKSYSKNAESIRARIKIYQSNNRERQKERFKVWAKNNKEAFRAHQRSRRAREKGAVGKHTANDILFLLEKQHYKCVNCRKSVRKSRHVDHIMPLAKGGSNDRKNLQILCPHCNISKNAKHPIDWAQEQGRLL